MRQWGCPIFMAKIQQSFVFGALWRTSKVLRLCILRVSTCSYCDEPKPFKVLSMLMHVAYTRKLMSLADMDMHLWQLPWAHTHSTRSKALMTREGHSHSHKSPSYKMHNHPYTSRYRYTYIMHNAITQSRKVNQTLPTFQGYGPVRYKKCKIDISCNRPKQGAGKVKGSTWRGA